MENSLHETLDPGYSSEVDQIDKDAWHRLMVQFDDASFYQTWSYGSVQWGDRQLSHLVLKHEERAVAMAQLRVVGMPAVRIGIAFLSWGPMWRPKGEAANPLHLKNIMSALRQEYAVRRGYLVRMFPRVAAGGESEEIRRAIEQEDYVRKADPLQTIIVDLSPSFEDLRRSLSRSWSRSLSFAERQDLEVTEDTSDEACDIALRIANEMRTRKHFYEYSQATIAAAHKDLPEPLKLRIAICRDQSEPVAVLGWTTLGQIGISLLGGTRQNALKSKASFLLYWRMVEYYKRHGFRAVDLAGVNQKRNPGGYFFKSGLAGQNSKEPNRFIGRFDACVNPASALVAKAAYGIHSGRKKLMYRLNKLLEWARLAGGSIARFGWMLVAIEFA